MQRTKREYDRSSTKRFFCNSICMDKVGSKPRSGTEVKCEQCGTKFYRMKSSTKRFCSVECRKAAAFTVGQETRTCANCGDEFEFSLSMSKWNAGTYCSVDCRIEHKRTSAIGRRKIRQDGYAAVFQPDAEGAQATGWILEHRYVMQNELGRPLFPLENVHHINGQRDDNRLENLELWTTWQPSGQRLIDKIKWAKELLATYDGMSVE